MSKVATAFRVWREGGIAGVARVSTSRATAPLRARWSRLANWWRFGDHWFLGKWIELTGNRVRLDECEFDLNHPSIPTRLKSRFVLDTYEFRERHAVRKFLNPDLPVVEFGGGIGAVSCIVNKRLREPRRHVVVEANADLLSQIERNREINRCFFTLRHAALAYGTPVVQFDAGNSYLEGKVGDTRGAAKSVPATGLGTILEEFSFESAALVCDIEGAEFDLLRHEGQVLASRIALIIIEGHDVPGKGTRAQLKSGILNLGFRCLAEGGCTFVFAPK